MLGYCKHDGGFTVTANGTCVVHFPVSFSAVSSNGFSSVSLVGVPLIIPVFGSIDIPGGNSGVTENLSTSPHKRWSDGHWRFVTVLLLFPRVVKIFWGRSLKFKCYRCRCLAHFVLRRHSVRYWWCDRGWYASDHSCLLINGKSIK